MLKLRGITWPMCAIALLAVCGSLLLAMPPQPDNSAKWVDVNTALILFAAAMWVLFLTIKAYPAGIGLTGYAIGVAAILTLALWGIDKLLLSAVLTNHPMYLHWTQHTQWSRLLTGFGALVWPATAMALTRRTTLLEDKLKAQSDAASMLREAELFRLRQQLQPHFLFNSLNAVSSLILLAPDKAIEVIGKLSHFLRVSVKRDGQAVVPLVEELDYIRTYLDIEGTRFGDRLKTKIQSDAPEDAFIPPALLQPLIENAVKFGIYGTAGAVGINVDVRQESTILHVTISNPYDAAIIDKQGTGFGLEGVSRRLYLLYARTDLLIASSENGMFTVHLKIPQVHV